MIYISFALFIEAKPFIQKYSLIKDTSFTKAQVFKGDKITAIITGTGVGNSEIALTYALTLLKPNNNDIFANYGICGSNNNIGKTFLINSIYDTINDKTYFTDIIYKHNFEENKISTFPFIVKNPKGLCDMEAAFLYKAAQLFFSQHRIFIFKTVSDNGNNILSEYIQDIIETDIIYDFLLSLPYEKTDIFDKNEIYEFEKFCSDGRFTDSMKINFRQILRYKKLSENINICEFLKENHIDNKKGGKKLIEKLSKYL